MGIFDNIRRPQPAKPTPPAQPSSTATSDTRAVPVLPAAKPAEKPAASGEAVNAFSNAIDPRKLYPSHFDFLMRDLFANGEAPERWRIIDASETRLDEHGMEIEFTMVRLGTDLVWRRRVLVDAGRLVSIKTY